MHWQLLRLNLIVLQRLGSKLLPIITNAAKTQPKRTSDAVVRMGLAEKGT